MRVSFFQLSKPDADKAKAVICALVRESGGELRGQTRLYKAFYFAHLYHWCKKDGVLSQYPIARMPKGPGIDDGDGLLNEMVSDNLISKEMKHAGPYPEAVFKLVESCQPSITLSDDELDAVRDAVEYIRDKSATELSDITHEYSRSWNNNKNGDIVDPYIDLVSDDDHNRIKQHQGEAARLINSVFGEGFVGPTR